MSKHKFLWRDERQSRRFEEEPDNYRIFIRIDAPMTLEEVGAVRDLFQAVSDRRGDYPWVRLGQTTCYGKIDIFQEKRMTDPVIASLDGRYKRMGDVEYDFGTPPVSSFSKIDAVMDDLAELGLTCATCIETGQGDYWFYAVWRPGGPTPEFEGSDSKSCAVWRAARSPIPRNREEECASIGRIRPIEELTRKIAPKEPPYRWEASDFGDFF